ncbi:MAG: 50S ribosomal protein L29 [Candidatus Paceibacterota bacterium]|jgi:ribosomal protein L29
MNIKDVRNKTAGELQKELQEKAESLNKFKFGISGSKIKNVKEGKNLRKDIAQIMTILNEKKAQ